MPDISQKLRRKLRKTDTLERCGFVLKSGRLKECANTHPDPAKGFRIAPETTSKNLNDIIGFWHTHPNMSAALSQDDYFGFAQWPGYTHYIVGSDGVRSYTVDDDGVIREAH